MESFKLLSFIFLVVLISGCIGGGTTTKIESKELVKINSIDFFPSNKVNAGDPITIRMEIENVGQKEVKYLINTENDVGLGNALLFDHCSSLYTMEEGDFRMIPDYTKECISISGEKGCWMELREGDIQIFQWNIEAPSNDKIAGITHQCDFKFQIKYLAEAETNSYIYFADESEIIQRIYTKKDLSQAGDNIATFGPVVVNLETPPQPIPVSGTDSDTWIVYLNIKNAGNGIAEIKDLKLEVPEDMTPDEGENYKFKDCELFMKAYPHSILNNPETGTSILGVNYISAEELEKIQIYGKQSSKNSCILKAPKISILQPFRFTSKANYTYSIIQTKRVTTNKE